MKQSQKPFLPSKKELKGCLWLFLIIPVLAVMATIGKITADFFMAIVPLAQLLVASGIILLLIVPLWFYRKRKQNKKAK